MKRTTVTIILTATVAHAAHARDLNPEFTDAPWCNALSATGGVRTVSEDPRGVTVRVVAPSLEPFNIRVNKATQPALLALVQRYGKPELRGKTLRGVWVPYTDIDKRIHVYYRLPLWLFVATVRHEVCHEVTYRLTGSGYYHD